MRCSERRCMRCNGGRWRWRFVELLSRALFPPPGQGNRRSWTVYRLMQQTSCGAELRDIIARESKLAAQQLMRMYKYDNDYDDYTGERIEFMEQNLTIDMHRTATWDAPCSFPLTARTWACVRAELIGTLRGLMSPWDCCDQEGFFNDYDDHEERKIRLEPHHPYWHHTVYWLCEILAVLCGRFALMLLPPAPIDTPVVQLSYDDCLSAGYIDLTKVVTSVVVGCGGGGGGIDKWARVEDRATSRLRRGVRWAAFRWRFAALQRDVTSVKCRSCVQRMLSRLAITVERITTTTDSAEDDNVSVTIIAVASEYARLYRRAMSLATSSCGPRHEAAVAFTDRWCRDFPTVIRVHLPRLRCDFARVAPHPGVIPDGSTCLKAIARLARAVVTRAPWYTHERKYPGPGGGSARRMTIDVSMPESFFEVSHRLPMIMSRLFGVGGLRFCIVYEHEGESVVR